MRKILIVAGLLVVAAGLIAGLAPVSSHGVDCGSVLRPAAYMYDSDACGDTRSMLAIPTWIALLIGGAVLAIGLLQPSTRQTRLGTWLAKRESRGHSVFERRDTGEPYKPAG